MGLLAGVIGVLVPGWGQAVNKQFAKGLAVFTLMLVFVLGVWFLLKGNAARELGAFSSFVFFSIYSGMDAYLFDERKRDVEEKQLEEFGKLQKESLKAKPKKPELESKKMG